MLNIILRYYRYAGAIVQDPDYHAYPRTETRNGPFSACKSESENPGEIGTGVPGCIHLRNPVLRMGSLGL